MVPPTDASLGPATPTYATLSDLGLPGVRHILDRKAPIWSRASWAAIILVCMALAAWQVNERIKFLRDSSISVDVRAVPNAALNFPYLTICTRNRERDPLLQKTFRKISQDRYGNKSLWHQMDVCDVMGYKNRTGDDAWIPTLNCRVIFFQRTTADVPSPQIKFTWSVVPSYFGVCITFYPELFPIRTLTAELRFIFARHDRMPNEQLVLYSVLLHKEPHVTDIELAMADDLPFLSNIVHTLEVNEFTYLNTKQNPCTGVHEHSRCRKRCLNEFVVKAANCQLPYMTTDKSNPLPKCLNPEECRQATESTLAVYSTHDWNACNCPRQCRKTVYGGSRTIDLANEKHTYLRIGVQSTRVTLAEEYYSYTIVSFLCDVGGTLGLFLGLCLLTVFEIFEGLFWSLLQLLKKKKKEVKICSYKTKMYRRNLSRRP